MTSQPPVSRPADTGDGMDRIWTIPNAISFARLVILLPITMWLMLTGHYWWALLVLVLLAGSDWVDGWLARRLNQRTLLGTRLDPVADRISVVVIALTLAITDVVPWWMLAVIVAVDVVLLGLALVLFGGSPDLPVSLIGKLRTAALFLGLVLLIIAQASGAGWLRTSALVLTGAGVVGHLAAGIGYGTAMVRNRRRLRRRMQRTA